jgi:hypothetical protein
MSTFNESRYPRRLQVFSLDPSADVRLDTAMISRCVLKLRWEERLQPGPVGDYIEVIDYDPSSACGYDPVDLNQRSLLATDGLAPSTGNPQFHQQMVYAVVMHTIYNFERVLGRKVFWAERREDEEGKNIYLLRDRFVRLRIYPHALRQQNAYYSPARKALLFGYFNAPTMDPRNELPGGLVFTCLSHDIIAHETTHAILDGIHPHLLDNSNADMLAFHEAFADIVAIFQHFTLPGLLLDQVQKTRGELKRNNLLTRLAIQFARSTDRGDALRNALGEIDENGNRQPPDPTAFGRTTEPHARGAILVAAVFDAFLGIYEDRVADLRRIATEGTGILPDGDIHPDLAHRFAQEAMKASERVLKICIRAIDYLPPVDITFGDYLRALITADADLVPDDPHRYRLAFIEGFRERGIYPLDVRTLSEESLKWSAPSQAELQALQACLPPPNMLRAMAYSYDAAQVGHAVKRAKRDIIGGRSRVAEALKSGDFKTAEAEFLKASWKMANQDPGASDEEQSGELLGRFVLDKIFAIILHNWIEAKLLHFDRKESSVAPSDTVGQAAQSMGLDVSSLANAGHFAVQSVRPTVRARPDGRTRTELLIVLTQKHFEPLLDEDGQPLHDAHDTPLSFRFLGGSTLIIDPDTGQVEYSISKRLTSRRRMQRQQAFMLDQFAEHEQDAVEQFGLTRQAAIKRKQMEPLAVVHSHDDEGEGLY